MNHYMRLAIGAALDACDTADRHTGGVAAVTVLALVIAGLAWVALHGFACRCDDCYRPRFPKHTDAPVIDTQPGRDHDALIDCELAWNGTGERT